MKFIHCADLHLDTPFTLSSPAESQRRRTELRSDFASLVLLAKSENCRMFFISGDLFDDKTVTKDTFELLYRETSMFPECRFFISPGNHDPYYEKSPYMLMDMPDNVHVFSSDKLEYVDVPEENVRVYGCAFTSDTKTSSPLSGFSVENTNLVNILVMHGDVCSGISNYCPIAERDIAASGFDYAALGHIHKASGLKYAGKVPYAYPGCLEGRGFDETGYKGALVGDISKERLEIKSVKISKRRYEIAECDVTGASDIASAADKILSCAGGYGEDTALRLILNGVTFPEFSADSAELRKLLPKPFILEIKDRTLPLYNAEYLKKDGTVIGEFYRRLEPTLSDGSPEERRIASAALKLGLQALYGRELQI